MYTDFGLLYWPQYILNCSYYPADTVESMICAGYKDFAWCDEDDDYEEEEEEEENEEVEDTRPAVEDGEEETGSSEEEEECNWDIQKGYWNTTFGSHYGLLASKSWH